MRIAVAQTKGQMLKATSMVKRRDGLHGLTILTRFGWKSAMVLRGKGDKQ